MQWNNILCHFHQIDISDFPSETQNLQLHLLPYLKKDVNVKKIKNFILQDKFCATLFLHHTEFLPYGGYTSLVSRSLAAAVHKHKNYVPQLVRESVFSLFSFNILYCFVKIHPAVYIGINKLKQIHSVFIQQFLVCQPSPGENYVS